MYSHAYLNPFAFSNICQPFEEKTSQPSKKCVFKIWVYNYAPYYQLDQHNYSSLSAHKCDIINPTKEQEGCNSMITDF